MKEPQKVGILTASPSRGKEVFAFEYEKSWLVSAYKFQIDPELFLFEGKFYPNAGIENFGAFSDSAEIPERNRNSIRTISLNAHRLLFSLQFS